MKKEFSSGEIQYIPHLPKKDFNSHTDQKIDHSDFLKRIMSTCKVFTLKLVLAKSDGMHMMYSISTLTLQFIVYFIARVCKEYLSNSQNIKRRGCIEMMTDHTERRNDLLKICFCTTLLENDELEMINLEVKMACLSCFAAA